MPIAQGVQVKANVLNMKSGQCMYNLAALQSLEDSNVLTKTKADPSSTLTKLDIVCVVISFCVELILAYP